MNKRAAVAPDVVDLLKTQHTQIRRQFRKAMLPGPMRARAFAELRRLLAVHEAAEESHVHPVAKRAAKGGKRLIGARLAEEEQAKKLLKELDRIGPDGRGYLPMLRRLRAAVLAHAEHEEKEEFPVLLEAITGARRRSLGAESTLTQAVAPTHPHPAVNTQLANKLAAPIAGPLDRGRDLVMGLIRR